MGFFEWDPDKRVLNRRSRWAALWLNVAAGVLLVISHGWDPNDKDGSLAVFFLPALCFFAGWGLAREVAPFSPQVAAGVCWGIWAVPVVGFLILS